MLLFAGAAAASGADLGTVAAEASLAAAALGTMGVALGACTVPAAGKPGAHALEIRRRLLRADGAQQAGEVSEPHLHAEGDVGRAGLAGIALCRHLALDGG